MAKMIKIQNKRRMQSMGESICCKQKIIELVEKIENPEILKLIYGLVKSGYAEEKAGSE